MITNCGIKVSGKGAIKTGNDASSTLHLYAVYDRIAGNYRTSASHAGTVGEIEADDRVITGGGLAVY